MVMFQVLGITKTNSFIIVVKEMGNSELQLKMLTDSTLSDFLHVVSFIVFQQIF